MFIGGVGLVSPVRVDRNVSFGPAPSGSELEWLSREYSHVVVLTYPHEMQYDVNMWSTLGVKFLHVPVTDFRSPQLLDLVDIVEWVLSRVSEGGRVYIHCARGFGRSAAVAAAYLMRRYGKSWFDAVTQVRNIREGSLESVEQLSVLKAYEVLLRHVNPSDLIRTLKCSDIQSRNHVSKILQIGMKMSEEFSLVTNIQQEVLIEALLSRLSTYVSMQPTVKCTFRDKLTVSRKPRRLVNAGSDESEVLRLFNDLSIASDMLMNQCIEDLEMKIKGDALEVTLYCSGGYWSSCVVVKKYVEDIVVKLRDLISRSPKVRIIGFLDIRMKFLHLPQDHS